MDEALKRNLINPPKIRRLVQPWWDACQSTPPQAMPHVSHLLALGKPAEPKLCAANSVEQAELLRNGLREVMGHPMVQDELEQKTRGLPDASPQLQQLFRDTCVAFRNAIQPEATWIASGNVSPFSALELADAGYFVPWKPFDEYARLRWEYHIRRGTAVTWEDVAAEQLHWLTYELAVLGPVGVYQIQTPSLIVLQPDGRVDWKYGHNMVRLNPYLGCPLPNLQGHTISASYLIATYGILNTLTAGPPKKIFEAGVGSWRHLAYLSAQFPNAQLYGCDCPRGYCPAPPAIQKLGEIGLDITSRAHVTVGNLVFNIDSTSFVADGPYDIINVSFACPHYEGYFEQLLSQLNDGGILVIPMSTTVANGECNLLVIRRCGDQFVAVQAVDCSFMPAENPTMDDAPQRVPA